MYRLIDDYYPAAGWMLKDLQKLPQKYKVNGMNITSFGSNDPADWLSGRTEADVVESLSTVIHESIHGYTSEKVYQYLQEQTPEDYNFKDEYSAFFIDQDRVNMVKHTEVYDSNLLKKDIPKALRTFRYNPYIAPKSNLGSQKDGIYGLLDEFNAYYQGAKMVMQMLPYYEDLADKAEGFQEFVSAFSSDRLAFYEFSYFTLAYLIKSENQYAYEFKALLANEPLRQTYTAVYKGFEQLDRQFDELLDQKIQSFKAAGRNARISDDFFFIDGSGVGVQLKEINLLRTELSKDIYQDMLKKFLIN